MSTGNPNYGVGGTAKDGGLSTADTVRDGGSDGGNRGADDTYVPSSGGHQTRSKTSAIASDVSAREGTSSTEARQAVLDGNAASGGGGGGGGGGGSGAHVGNPNRNVGGTAGDGGVSTADTVADGGPDPKEEDADFKP